MRPSSANAGGMTARGKARNSCARALAKPESRPCQYGECAARPCSTRQVGAQPVARADRALGVGHADVDVQRAGRRAAHEARASRRRSPRSARPGRAAPRRTARRGGSRSRSASRPASRMRSRTAPSAATASCRVAGDRRGGLDLRLVDVGLGGVAEPRQDLARAMVERERAPGRRAAAPPPRRGRATPRGRRRAPRRGSLGRGRPAGAAPRIGSDGHRPGDARPPSCASTRS